LPRNRTAAKFAGPPSNVIDGILSKSSTKVVAPVFFISDLSNFIEVAIGPIKGLDVLYSEFNVIFIGPNKAFAVLDICMAMSITAKKNFLRVTHFPNNQFNKKGIRDGIVKKYIATTHHPS